MSVTLEAPRMARRTAEARALFVAAVMGGEDVRDRIEDELDRRVASGIVGVMLTEASRPRAA